MTDTTSIPARSDQAPPNGSPTRGVGQVAGLVGSLAATVAAGIAAGSLVVGARYIVEQLTVPEAPVGRARYGFTPWELGVDYEDVAFPAIDGATLRGWWLRRPASTRAIIALHGYRGRRVDLLGISAALWRAGYNVLLFDYRGHGDSDGQRVTLGHAETEDFRSAVQWVQQRVPQGWLGTLGYSMGGTVALLGTALEPAVRAVATDGAFCRQEERIRSAWRRRMRVSPTPFVELAERLVERRHGFRFRDVDALAAVARIGPRPMLVIHALEDAVVPVEDAQRLYDAATGPKDLWLIPDVPHCAGYFADRPAYCARVIAFFDRAATADQHAAAAQVSA